MLAILLLLTLSWGQDTEVLIAALARVGDEVITSRDLQINQFLNEVENPFKNYNEKPEPLKELVWEYLVYQEAKTVFSQKPSDSEIHQFMEAFNSKAGKDKLWKSLNVMQNELRQAVVRKLSAKKLLNLKMPQQLIYVSSAEIESYYKSNKNQLGQKPLADVREDIRIGLQQLKARSRFYDWAGRMGQTYKVSYFSGFKIQ